MGLGKRGYLEGKLATCYPGFEQYLKGATVRDDIGVAEDGNVITAAGMGVALDFALALVAALKGSQVAEDLSKSLQAHRR